MAASNTRHKGSTPTELFEGDFFFSFLNINKCLQLFQDCYVLLRYTQILSLQVKTVIPKSFPLGQINRFYAWLLRMLWLIVWLSTAYCSPGTVRTFCSQHRVRRQSFTAQPCQPLWPGDWSVRALVSSWPSMGDMDGLWEPQDPMNCGYGQYLTRHTCRLMHFFFLFLSSSCCCCCYGIFLPCFLLPGYLMLSFFSSALKNPIEWKMCSCLGSTWKTGLVYLGNRPHNC